MGAGMKQEPGRAYVELGVTDSLTTSRTYLVLTSSSPGWCSRIQGSLRTRDM
jgi:hypothetical protein